MTVKEKHPEQTASSLSASPALPSFETPEKLPTLLSVKQLAALLYINEKKVYQLAADGEIPCTKVTGKWLFPTQLVHDWIIETSHAGSLSDRLVIAGADDLLLDRLFRRLSLDLGRSGVLCYNPCGSMHGLRLLAARRADGCFFHWGAYDRSDIRHLGLLRSFREHRHWVSVRCVYRNECLALSPRCFNKLKKQLGDLPGHNTPITDPATLEQLLRLLSSEKLQWAQRHHESGTQRLLEDICSQFGMSPNKLSETINYYAGERETAAAVAHDQSDIALTSEAVAREYDLQFVTINKVAIDLVMLRKTYFQNLSQTLLKKLSHTDEYIQNQWNSSYQLPDEDELHTVKSL